MSEVESVARFLARVAECPSASKSPDTVKIGLLGNGDAENPTLGDLKALLARIETLEKALEQARDAAQLRIEVVSDNAGTYEVPAKSPDFVDALIAAVEREALERAWRPIESAPKDGTAILVWTRWEQTEEYPCPSFECVQVARWCDSRSNWEREKIGEPTHWMPFPEPPGRALIESKEG